MKKIALLLLVFLNGCALTTPTENKYIKPIKNEYVDETSTSTGYIAISGLYRQRTYDNFGNMSQDWTRAAYDFDNNDLKFKSIDQSNNNRQVALHLNLEKYAENKLHIYPIPVGKYQRPNNNNYSQNSYTGIEFEIHPGTILYFGHVHDEKDLERNVLLGDHYEQICSGVADKLSDAKETISSFNSNIKVDGSLIHTFRMYYPESGRTRCNIVKQK